MSTLAQLMLSLAAITLATVSVTVFQFWKFVIRLRQQIKISEFLAY